MVRFHGRRTETWEAKGIPVVERFRYLYDADDFCNGVCMLRILANFGEHPDGKSAEPLIC